MLIWIQSDPNDPAGPTLLLFFVLGIFCTEAAINQALRHRLNPTSRSDAGAARRPRGLWFVTTSPGVALSTLLFVLCALTAVFLLIEFSTTGSSSARGIRTPYWIWMLTIGVAVLSFDNTRLIWKRFFSREDLLRLK